MPTDIEPVDHAIAGGRGILTHRLGPLPVWTWGGGVLGGVGAFIIFRRLGPGGRSSAAGAGATAAPAVSSQTAGPSQGGLAVDNPASNAGSQATGPASTTVPEPPSAVAALYQAIAALSGQVAAVASRVASLPAAGQPTPASPPPGANTAGAGTSPTPAAAATTVTPGPGGTATVTTARPDPLAAFRAIAGQQAAAGLDPFAGYGAAARSEAAG